MIDSSVKRFILPFSPLRGKQSFNSQVEEAAVFAFAELERSKGGGFILKQKEEQIYFIAKIGYPLWLYPKNEAAYILDGLNASSYVLTFAELPNAQVFMDSLDANSKTREDYMTFLLDHVSYFAQPKRERQLLITNLITDPDFKNEFNAYRKESVELGQTASFALLSPSLDEVAISSMLTEVSKIKSSLKEDAEKLHECLRLLNKTTSQCITEIDYSAKAVADEANARIRAQEEVINPKIAKLSSEYKRRIADLSKGLDQELENLEKQKSKTEKSIESEKGKIHHYQKEAQAQAEKKHSIYEKQWKEKISKTKKDLNGLKKELKSIEKKIKVNINQKNEEISKLQFALDEEIKYARRPLQDLESSRDAKLQVFKDETLKLLKLEKPVTDGLADVIKLSEAINAKFEVTSSTVTQLNSPALFYVPFYVICYQAGVSKHCVFLSPSMASEAGFGAKLKSAFGKSNIKELFAPRFKALTTVIDNISLLTKRDYSLDSQINSLGEKNNLIGTCFTRKNIGEGLAYLRSKGWLSDKEYLSVINCLP